jgi:type IV secretory pathway TraG/TraD family ATPase VirD4
MARTGSCHRPKGENYAVTAKQRAKMGDRLVVLDPFRVTDCSAFHRLNPLDLIDIKGRLAADDAAVVAKLICKDGVLKTDPFWDERAESLITGIILYVLMRSSPARRNLAEVAHYVESSSVERLMYPNAT